MDKQKRLDDLSESLIVMLIAERMIGNVVYHKASNDVFVTLASSRKDLCKYSNMLAKNIVPPRYVLHDYERDVPFMVEMVFYVGKDYKYLADYNDDIRDLLYEYADDENDTAQFPKTIEAQMVKHKVWRRVCRLIEATDKAIQALRKLQ